MDDKQSSGDSIHSIPLPSVPAQVHFDDTSACPCSDYNPTHGKVQETYRKKEVNRRNGGSGDTDAGDDEGIHGPTISELPAYTETKVQGDRVPTALDSSHEPDLEPGLGSRGHLKPERSKSDSDGVVVKPTTPRDRVHPGYIDEIGTALADVANRVTASESPYYVRQSHIDAVTTPCTHHQSSPSQKRINPFNLWKKKKNVETKRDSDRTCCPDLTREQHRILGACFELITHGVDDLLIQLLDSNLVDANTSNYSSAINWRNPSQGKYPTPLVTAIKARNKTTAVILLEHGADVNGWSTMDVLKLKTVFGRERWLHVQRTPLQIAAQEGNLLIVKLLMEKHGADDSLIAPTDGQTALRLAADAKQKDIVAYLPTRRGGTRLRCRSKWHRAASNMHKIISPTADFVTIVFWHAPKRFLKWTFVDLPEFLWECARYLPSALWKLAKAIPDLIKKFPKFLAETIVDLFKVTLRIIRKLPGICVDVAKRLWTAIKQLFTSISKIIARLLSFFHTAFLAVTTFFRNLTLTNLLHALLDLSRAVFIDFPRLLVELTGKSVMMLGDVMVKVFGMTGLLIFMAAYYAFLFLAFLPKQGFRLVKVLVGVVGDMLKEVAVWLDPKRI